MRRRTVLRRIGIGAAAVTATGASAGCLDERIVKEVSDDGSDDSGSDNTTDNGTDATDDGTNATDDGTNAVPSIASQTIETTRTACATGSEADGDAVVATAGDRIEITGGLEAPNPCHEAVLSAVELAGDGTELAVTIGVTPDDAELCQQCLARIEYAATITFDGGAPETATVTHAAIGGEDDVEETTTEESAADDETGGNGTAADDA